MSNVSNLFRISVGYANAYNQKKDYKNSLDIMLWMANMLKPLKAPGVPSYVERELALIYNGCADICVQWGHNDDAREYLRLAREAAISFDANPVYDFCGMKFFTGNRNVRAFDSFGHSCVEGIVASFDENPESGPTLKQLWSEL